MEKKIIITNGKKEIKKPTNNVKNYSITNKTYTEDEVKLILEQLQGGK